MRKLTPLDIDNIEELIRATKEKPMNPDKFIPWSTPMDGDFNFMPESLFSLQGQKLFNTLTKEQKRELAKAEVGQAMYSYAWSEGLACMFFFRHISSLMDSTSAEYRYLLIEAFEECCHQQMFSRAVQTLNIPTVPPRPLHRFFGWFATRFLSSGILFMSVLAIEIVTEVYGEELMKDPKICPMLAKISLLHKIEEERHIRFGEILLKRHTEDAGLIRRSIYSIVVCLNIYFMRTLYVRKEIFERIGLDPKIYYKPAYRGLKNKFGKHCLGKAIKFVDEFNGFNWLTRILWRKLLDAKI